MFFLFDLLDHVLLLLDVLADCQVVQCSRPGKTAENGMPSSDSTWHAAMPRLPLVSLNVVRRRCLFKNCFSGAIWTAGDFQELWPLTSLRSFY